MMKLAVTSTLPGFDGTVPTLFSETPYLLVVDMDSGEILDIIARSSMPGSREEQDMALAREVLRWNCEGVLCGPLERPPFLVIADEGQVTRYNAAGMSLQDALNGADRRELALIRDHIDGSGCQGEHKDGSDDSQCECGHHDH